MESTTTEVMNDIQAEIEAKWERINKENTFERISAKFPFGFSQFAASEWRAIVSQVHSAGNRLKIVDAVKSLGLFDVRTYRL